MAPVLKSYKLMNIEIGVNLAASKCFQMKINEVIIGFFVEEFSVHHLLGYNIVNNAVLNPLH